MLGLATFVKVDCAIFIDMCKKYAYGGTPAIYMFAAEGRILDQFVDERTVVRHVSTNHSFPPISTYSPF